MSGYDGQPSRVALVTGGNKGIGRAVVVKLAEMGMTALLGARDGIRGEQAATELRARGLHVDAVKVDVTDAGSVAAAATLVTERWGRLDILVNNAGIAGEPARQQPGSVDHDVVRAVFDTNVFGVIAMTDAMIPLLRRSAAGRVVNVSSALGSLAWMTDSDHDYPAVAYGSSKTALNALTVRYAKEFHADGILVNSACPGLCATDMTDRRSGVTRTAADGAAIIVRLATLGADGPTGGYFNDDGPLPW